MNKQIRMPNISSSNDAMISYLVHREVRRPQVKNR